MHRFQSGHVCRMVISDEPTNEYPSSIDWDREALPGIRRSSRKEFCAWQNSVAKTLIKVWHLELIEEYEGGSQSWGKGDRPLVQVVTTPPVI